MGATLISVPEGGGTPPYVGLCPSGGNERAYSEVVLIHGTTGGI